MIRLEYVYLIRHKPTGNFYAGSSYSKTCHPEKFWVSYFTSSKVVKRLLREDSESFEVLEVIPRPLNDAREFEVSLLQSVDAARSPRWINRTNGHGKFGCCGAHSESTKAKIGDAHRGKPKPPMPEEIKQKISNSLRGRKRSDEERAAISRGRTGIKLSDSARNNISKSQVGRKTSEKSKKKISEKLKGKVRSEETKAKMAASAALRPIVECPHCGKKGAINNLARWHFDNCKQK